MVSVDGLRAENVALRRQRAMLGEALDNLLLQRERQRDVEKAGWTGSYPRKFPEWVRAWEMAHAAITCLEGEIQDVVQND